MCMNKEASGKDYGLVYVLTNPAMPGLVKIGMTVRSSLEQRMKELYGTGVPVPFDCAYACKVKSSKTKVLEQALHEAFQPYRVNPKREFFEILPDQAIAILRVFDEGDVTGEVEAEINHELTPEEQLSTAKLKTMRPKLNYAKLGIPVGSVLHYKKDENITVTVLDDCKVCYLGEACSLTGATKSIMGLPAKSSIQPTSYWLYNNRNLMDIYNSVYPIED